MKIIGAENITRVELQSELENGGRFVVFKFCFSILIMTFRRSSTVFFVRAGQSPFRYSWKYILITLFFGWWGIPWGLIYTPGCLFNQLKGGTDCTQEVVQALEV